MSKTTKRPWIIHGKVATGHETNGRLKWEPRYTVQVPFNDMDEAEQFMSLLNEFEDIASAVRQRITEGREFLKAMQGNHDGD